MIFLLWDTEVGLGELFKQMPKAPGARTDLQPADATVARLDKPKQEAIRALGFSPKQAECFETLAAHPDLVEQDKSPSRGAYGKQRRWSRKVIEYGGVNFEAVTADEEGQASVFD